MLRMLSISGTIDDHMYRKSSKLAVYIKEPHDVLVIQLLVQRDTVSYSRSISQNLSVVTYVASYLAHGFTYNLKWFTSQQPNY